MNDPERAVASLAPLILMLSPFAIYYWLRWKRRRDLTFRLALRFDTFGNHLANDRPDSARALLKDVQMDFSRWAAWKEPLLTRYGRYFLEAMKNWADEGRSRDRFRWAVALGESVALLAPREAELTYRHVAYDTYRYLYQSGLTLLPYFPDLQIEVLRLGRAMGALSRQVGTATVYDEMAIANDIRAHLAAAQPAAVSAVPAQGALPVPENRLLFT